MIRAHPSEWAVLVGDRNIPHSRRRGADIHGRPSQGRDRHESPTSQATERRTAPGVTPLPRVRIMGCRVHHLRQTRAKPHPSQSGTQLSRGLLGLEMGYRVGAGVTTFASGAVAPSRSRRTLPKTETHRSIRPGGQPPGWIPLKSVRVQRARGRSTHTLLGRPFRLCRSRPTQPSNLYIS